MKGRASRGVRREISTTITNHAKGGASGIVMVGAVSLVVVISAIAVSVCVVALVAGAGKTSNHMNRT